MRPARLTFFWHTPTVCFASVSETFLTLWNSFVGPFQFVGFGELFFDRFFLVSNMSLDFLVVHLPERIIENFIRF